MCPGPDSAELYLGRLVVYFGYFCKCSLDVPPDEQDWPHGLCPMRPPGQEVIVTGTLTYEERDFYPARYSLRDASICVANEP